MHTRKLFYWRDDNNVNDFNSFNKLFWYDTFTEVTKKLGIAQTCNRIKMFC